MESRYSGIPVSPGIARGPAFIGGSKFEAPESYPIDPESIKSEIRRFEKAVLQTRRQILKLQQKLAEVSGTEDALIFDAHLLILEDQMLMDEILKMLNNEHLNVEFVVYDVAKRYMDSLSQVNDPYLQERCIDVQDVAQRIIDNLRGGKEAIPEGAQKPHLFFSHDLTPSDTAAIDRQLVLGFITEAGSQISHAAIMARSLGIPAIVGVKEICQKIQKEDEILLDGYHGVVIVNPSPETLAEYEELEAKESEENRKLASLKSTKSQTRDGRRIILSSNIELPEEIDLVQSSGAEGIGLYRTEFFYLKSDHSPSEEEQFQNYLSIAKATYPESVIIRTFDIGGDKVFPDLREEIERNPFLGWRGIRISLEKKEIFAQQLRAVLRASQKANLKVMFPFINSYEEVRQCLNIFEQCKESLRDQNIPFDEDIEVGVMIEIPSAAQTADLIAPEVDFFSIGTNDLIQYTLAVDRTNERVAKLFQPAHPAILRSIKQVVEAAHQNDIWVGLCGEMAGDIVFTPLLVGLGLDELSVGPSLVPRVKKAIQSLDYEKMREFVEELSELREAYEIFEACLNEAGKNFPDLMP